MVFGVVPFVFQLGGRLLLWVLTRLHHTAALGLTLVPFNSLDFLKSHFQSYTPWEAVPKESWPKVIWTLFKISEIKVGIPAGRMWCHCITVL